MAELNIYNIEDGAVDGGLICPWPSHQRRSRYFNFPIGNWQALAAERIENINRILWQNFDTGEIGIWRTDNNWNWLSSNVFTPNSTEIATVESLFGISL